MPVNDTMSIPYLIMSASTVVQLVMLLLVVGSILSWIVIFQRTLAMRRARAAHQAFEERFWSGVDLNELYRETPPSRKPRVPSMYSARAFASSTG